MMKKPEKKTVLVIISALLLGIFGFLVMENSRERTLGETFDEAAEEISGELNNYSR